MNEIKEELKYPKAGFFGGDEIMKDTTTQRSSPEDVFLKVQDVANMLHIGKSTVWLYSKVIEGFPPRVKIRGRVYWRKQDVIAWANDQ